MNTDQHAALAALPPGFTPIENPPGWTRAADLDLYCRARQPGGAPPLPTDASLVDAYQHALRLLGSAYKELGISLAVCSGFNSGNTDPKHVRALSRILRDALIAHFRAVELSLTCPHEADIRDFINSEADEAAFLEAEHDRLMDRHNQQPGSASLCELHALTARLGSLALDVVQHCWDSAEFEMLFSAVETVIGTGCLFLHTRLMPGEAGEQSLPVAA